MTAVLARRAVIFAVLALAGCGPSDDIRSYEVPKPTAPENPPDQPDAGPAEYRILGAMFPPDKPVWFVKLQGKAAALSAHEQAFDQFLASVRFPNGPDNPPAYDLPAGWTSAGPRTTMGITTHDVIKLAPADAQLELTVSAAMGSAQNNLKRWAVDLLGLPVTALAEPAKLSREVTTTAGAKGLRVDITGPKNPSGRPGSMGGK